MTKPIPIPYAVDVLDPYSEEVEFYETAPGELIAAELRGAGINPAPTVEAVIHLVNQFLEVARTGSSTFSDIRQTRRHRN